MDDSPYCMYFSAVNKSSYSALLGPVYKMAQTEYGLLFANMFLEKVKEVDDGRVFTQDEVRNIIKHGDDAFNTRTSADKDMRHRYLSDLVQRIMQVYNYSLDSDDQSYYDSTQSNLLEEYELEEV
jgi:hypothetical protein